MRSQFRVVEAGQEFESDDLNHVAADAALSEDRVLAELLRLQPYNGTSPQRGVIHAGLRRNDSAASMPQSSAIVYTQGSSNAKVTIAPFRAVIGSTSTDPELTLRDGVRTAMFVGGAGVEDTIQLAATAANKRWDLVYARVDVDIDEAAVTRFVKAVDGSESGETLQVYSHTTCTLGVVQGTEGASPSLPAIPSDSSSAYYIPLAYVALAHPFTLTDPITQKMIREVAPLLGVAAQAGGSDVAPMNGAHELTGFTTGWTPGSARPREHLPPTMAGKVERFFVLDFTGGNASLTLNTTTVIDNSIDWRNRIFKATIQVQAPGASGQVPWRDTFSAAPFCPGCDSATATNSVQSAFGQSFHDDFGGISNCKGHAAYLHRDFFSSMAVNSKIEIYVDSATGELKAKVAATSPGCLMFVWLDATTPFYNANPS